MISPSQKLNPKIFDKDVEKISTRTGFGEGLMRAGKDDERVVGLSADLSESVQMNGFKEKFPKRFIEVGVAEQNLATVASGMAAMGKIPFIGSYAVFSPGRNWEQIRTTIAYNDRKVIIVGSHAGVTVGPDGGSHQALEDVAMMRVLPRMTVVSPCDSIEARKATEALAKSSGPGYIRLFREKTPVITTEDTPFELGKARVLFEPIAGRPDVAILATGPLVHTALVAARELEKEKIGVIVVNISTIKPLDEEIVLRVAKSSGAIVTVEDHQIAGGMGSAVVEFLSSAYPVPIFRVGVHDAFGQSGTAEELLRHYGLDEKGIKAAVEKILKSKKTHVERS